MKECYHTDSTTRDGIHGGTVCVDAMHIEFFEMVLQAQILVTRWGLVGMMCENIPICFRMSGLNDCICTNRPRVHFWERGLSGIVGRALDFGCWGWWFDPQIGQVCFWIVFEDFGAVLQCNHHHEAPSHTILNFLYFTHWFWMLVRLYWTNICGIGLCGPAIWYLEGEGASPRSNVDDFVQNVPMWPYYVVVNFRLI